GASRATSATRRPTRWARASRRSVSTSGSSGTVHPQGYLTICGVSLLLTPRIRVTPGPPGYLTICGVSLLLTPHIRVTPGPPGYLMICGVSLLLTPYIRVTPGPPGYLMIGGVSLRLTPPIRVTSGPPEIAQTTRRTPPCGVRMPPSRESALLLRLCGG